MEQLHKQTNAAFDLLAAHKVGKEEKYNVRISQPSQSNMILVCGLLSFQVFCLTHPSAARRSYATSVRW